jgi:hypothetical protein
MLLLCDGGGSNNARHYIVKQYLYKLAQELNVNILMAHYPPYCSKWNPIEHCLFCHIHQAWEGTIFHNIQIIKESAEMTSTKTGLAVKVRVNKKEYLTKRKVDPNFKNNIQNFVTFDEKFPQWNYRFSGLYNKSHKMLNLAGKKSVKMAKEQIIENNIASLRSEISDFVMEESSITDSIAYEERGLSISKKLAQTLITQRKGELPKSRNSKKKC